MKRRTETDGVRGYQPNVMYCSDEPMRCSDCGDAIEPGDGYFVMIWENKIGAYCTKYSLGLGRVRGSPTETWDILKFTDRAKPIA